MTRTRRPSRAASCTGKTPHRDRQSAAAERVRRIRNGASHLTVYDCKFCDGWHVGHLRGWKQRARI